MNEPTSSEEIQRYFSVLQEGARPQDLRWIEETLDKSSELALMRLPNGALPLRLLLNKREQWLFQLLARHGAEHDIITACAAKDVMAVERFLREGPQRVYDTDEVGNTPLHWACDPRFSNYPRDLVKLVNLLVTVGSCVDARNVHGHTPLDQHLLKGNGEACETLFEHGAVPNVLYAVMAEDFGVLDEILDNEPGQIHWRDPSDGQTLLHFALRCECDLAMIEYLLGRGGGAELEARYAKAGWTPLLFAIRFHCWDAAEVFIRFGADVKASEKHETSCLPNRTALHMAVHNDRVGLAEMLIARGADVHEQYREGITLLSFAESAEMAELLIHAGVDPAIRDNFAQSPLDHAIEEGRRDVAALLVRHGLQPTFFHYVALGDCDQVRKMLDHDPTLITVHRQPTVLSPPVAQEEDSIEVPLGSVFGTALHYAAKSGVHEMVKLLLDRGADVNVFVGPTAWTPLHDATYATITRDFRDGTTIIRTLVAAGADLNAETVGGYRPLDIADYLSFYERSSDVFDLLLTLGRQYRTLEQS